MLIKSAEDNRLGSPANSTREDEEINEKGPGEFRKYGTGNNKMRLNVEECKSLQLGEIIRNMDQRGRLGKGYRAEGVEAVSGRQVA